MPEKHIPFFSFMDACNEPGCPVCTLVENRVEKFFDSLLYSGINDTGFRKNFRDNDGFCSPHALRFSGYNQGLAVAIPYRDLVQTKLREFKSLPRFQHNTLFRRIGIYIHRIEERFLMLFSTPKKEKSCMVCELIRDVESRFISLFFDFSSDAEMLEGLVSTGGFCIPHFQMALTSGEMPPQIEAMHRRRYRKLIHDLGRYIDSKNVTLGKKRPVLTREEELVWRDAMKIFYGCACRIKR